ncbi:MAG: stage II sporulation protein M [Bacteroidia bacterium]
MREAAFLKQNQDKWTTYESTPVNDPDELAERFIELTDDLAYAKTFYPGSTTHRYINGLTRLFHQNIYKNKKERTGRFKDFWLREIPLTVYANHKKLLYSFIIFTVFVIIGAFSASVDESFVRLVLGDSYVNETLENIRQGKPLAIYNSAGEVSMFLEITIRNIRVALTAFVFGVFLSFGTGYFLFHNGIMIGSFQYFFYQKGYLLTSVLTIWIHGTIEISAIIIAGAAGFCIGNSILFPKTLSRMESFKRGTKDGLKIAIGLIPFFIIAGFLESFVTRHADVSPALSASIIILSATLIISYFVIYPIRLGREQNKV